MWQAAGWLGMTVEMLEDRYGHHHPDFQDEAASAFGGQRQSSAIQGRRERRANSAMKLQ